MIKIIWISMLIAYPTLLIIIVCCYNRWNRIISEHEECGCKKRDKRSRLVNKRCCGKNVIDYSRFTDVEEGLYITPTGRSSLE